MICLKISKGQISNLRGFLGEKIISMKINEIKKIISDKLSPSWSILSESGFTDDWVSAMPGDDKILHNEERNVIISSSNPKYHAEYIKKCFAEDKCFLITTNALNNRKNSLKFFRDETKFFPEAEKTIADFEFLVYKIKNKRRNVKRDFLIKPLNKRDKPVKFNIEKEIRMIEDVKAVLIEIKSIVGSMQLTDPQKKALLQSRKTKDFFYFIFKLDFNFEINPEIELDDVSARIYKKI